MASNRKLTYGERRGSLFSSEKGRDRADANRQIEGLNIQSKQLDAAARQAARATEQSQQLHYIGERLYNIERMFLDFMNVYMAEHQQDGAADVPPRPPGY